MTSACTLPCAREGAGCALMGRRVLLLAGRAEAGAALAASLRLLGLEVLLPEATMRGGTPVLPPPVDLLLAAEAADLHDAADLVALLQEDRPWVPMILARPGGTALLLDPERGIGAPPAGTGDLATLIVRAVCRAARHHRAGRPAAMDGQAAPAPPA